MPKKRQPQSVRGIVRERLIQIEQDMARGISQATIVSQLGVPELTVDGFREALYRARRRVRTSIQTASPTAAPAAPQWIPAHPSNPRGQAGAPSGSRGTARPAAQPISDFLTASKTFKDEVIIGRKSK